MAKGKKPASTPVVTAPRAFGGGWKADAPDERDWKAGAFLGAPVSIPAEASLAHLVDDVNDQKWTSSCVGQALGKALQVRLRKIGFLLAFIPSFGGIYTLARRVGMKDAKAPLVDDGCFPRDAMTAIKELGVPSAKVWPFDPDKVNEELPWDVLQDATRFLVFQWFRITAFGESRSDAIAQAISKGFPVIFGLRVWDSFLSHLGDGLIREPGKDDAGGHMMTIVGYRTGADGKREFHVLNSWGLGWGDRGFCWIHEDVLSGLRASDFYVIQVSP